MSWGNAQYYIHRKTTQAVAVGRTEAGGGWWKQAAAAVVVESFWMALAICVVCAGILLLQEAGGFIPSHLAVQP